MNKRVYFFYGEEDFLIDEKIAAMKRQFDGFSLNVENFDGGNISDEEMSAAINSSPLLGGEKLVIVRDPDITSENQERFIALVKTMPPDVKLIFTARTFDKRTRFYRCLEEIGQVQEFKTFAPWEQEKLENWIIDRVKKNGKRINAGGARLLQEICGSNLRVLAGEAEKLATFTGEREEVKEEDIEGLASPGGINGFALLSALGEKDLNKALVLFQDLLRSKEDLFQLLSLIATQYRFLLQIKSLKTSERDPREIAVRIGGSPFFIRKCSVYVDRFTLEELKQYMENLLEANLKMKTGGPPEIVFELLLVSLCGKQNGN